MAQKVATQGGLVVVDKPGGMTSHDVVSRMRRLAKTRRVGHGGTLDPMATGVLIIAVGRATRLLRSEEHTSELQSRQYLVCRLLLEKKKTNEIPGQCDRLVVSGRQGMK